MTHPCNQSHAVCTLVPPSSQKSLGGTWRGSSSAPWSWWPQWWGTRSEPGWSDWKSNKRTSCQLVPWPCALFLLFILNKAKKKNPLFDQKKQHKSFSSTERTSECLVPPPHLPSIQLVLISKANRLRGIKEAAHSHKTNSGKSTFLDVALSTLDQNNRFQYENKWLICARRHHLGIFMKTHVLRSAACSMCMHQWRPDGFSKFILSRVEQITDLQTPANKPRCHHLLPFQGRES